MSDSAGRVIVIGDVMTDVIVIPEGPLVRGSDRRAQITQRPGGSGANQAVWLGSMGTPVSFVARVGAQDKPHLEAYLRGFHVDPVLIADPAQAVGHPGGHRRSGRGAELSDRSWREPRPVAFRHAGVAARRDALRAGVGLLRCSPKSRGMRCAGWPARRSRAVSRWRWMRPRWGSSRRSGPTSSSSGPRGSRRCSPMRDEAVALSGSDDLEAQMRVLGPNYGRVVIKLGAGGAAVGDASGVEAEAAGAGGEGGRYDRCGRCVRGGVRFGGAARRRSRDVPGGAGSRRGRRR